MVKNLPCNARDTGLIPGLAKSLHAVEQRSSWAETAKPEL